MFFFILSGICVPFGAVDVPFNSQSVRESLPLLSAGQRPASEEYARYLRHYGLDTIPVTIRAGWFTSDSFVCVGQVFIPENACGTVFFQHGLFDHTGIIANGIRHCVEQGFAVAAFDMPGHGLSSGEPAGISGFDEYVKAFSWFKDLCCDGIVDSPFVFIGHSTGCALGYSFTYQVKTQPFRCIVFLAPLARSAMYHLSVFGNTVMRPFAKSTMRWHRKQSHDTGFLRRLRNDPLQAKRFPLRWAQAYFSWWRGVRSGSGHALPLTVIQGTADGVVDWKYNLPFYRRMVPGVQIVRIRGARHQLLNETPEYAHRCFEVITGKLLEVRGNGDSGVADVQR